MQFHKCNFILQQYDNIYKCYVDYTASNDLYYLKHLADILSMRNKENKYRIIEVLRNV